MLEKIKNEPVIFMFRKMWKYSDSKKRILFFCFLFLISNILQLMFPLVFEKLLNEIQHNGVVEENLSLIFFYISLFVILSLVMWIFHGPARVIEGRNAVETEKNYQDTVIYNILHQDLKWHSDHESGNIIDKIEKGRHAIFDFSRSFYNFISIVVQTIGTFIAISFYNIYISSFLFIALGGAIFVIMTFDRYLVKQYKEINTHQNKISAKVFDSISNITSIVILNIKEKIGKDILDSIQKPIPLYIKSFILNESKWFSLSILLNILSALPLAFYIYYNYSHAIAIEAGSISALYMYLKKLTDSFMSFGGRYDDVVRQKTNMLNAEELENLEQDSSEISKEKFSNWEKIEIKKLEFSYTGEKKDVSIQKIVLEKGKKIAIIGESGGGKTTFLKILHGLYSTAQSEIIISSGKNSGNNKINTEKFLETNFSDINIESMLVPQEPELFSSTIKENITFGTSFPESEISEVLEISRAKEFIENLPKGLQSVVNEKGVNLSGGQKQRLALARALLFAQHKQLILLDESTSSVDPENETQIYQKIFEKFDHTTIIASIHKMNLLKYFDEIIIFENGTISDAGTFSSLLQKNSGFKKDWEKYIASQK